MRPGFAIALVAAILIATISQCGEINRSRNQARRAANFPVREAAESSVCAEAFEKCSEISRYDSSDTKYKKLLDDTSKTCNRLMALIAHEVDLENKGNVGDKHAALNVEMSCKAVGRMASTLIENRR
jgi:hypothetical protein